MLTQQLKQLPAKIAVSIALLLVVTAIAISRPSLLRSPERLAWFELAFFMLTIGSVKVFSWVTPQRRVSDLAVGKAISTLRRDAEVAAAQETFGANGEVARELEKIWRSPVDRAEWIVRFSETQDESTEQAAKVKNSARLLFREHRRETLQVRRYLRQTGSPYEMVVLEDQPLVGTLVEDAFQEFGVLVRRVPLPADMIDRVREEAVRLHLDTRLATSLSVKYRRRHDTPLFIPLVQLENDARLLRSLVPTSSGVSDEYVNAFREYLSAIIEVGVSLNSGSTTE